MPQPRTAASARPSSAPPPAASGIGRRVERGEQEDGGLEALAEDGEERHRDEGDHRSLGERGRHAPLELAAEAARVAPHPDDHRSDGDDRDESDDRLEPFLLPVRQLTAENLEPDADEKAQSAGQRDAGPDPAEHVPAPLLSAGTRR